ncbi:porin family protein [Hymenobacter setariae]|uniref:Porin family protein n=1 Tax=Hymenobacter setariae TaxID=2594794 RepID=A0A558BQ33_9BACT|nr:outer membrane beta-barrel protein [Hymenobacter setariae]TVT38585.1 porin family protein [Hymenobacter setariae]
MRKILLFSGLASLPLLGAAQSTTSRLYVGAGATVLTGKPFHTDSRSEAGPALTVGMQFTPRVALQLSGTYTWRNSSDSYPVYYLGGTTPDATFAYETRSKLFTFPLLLRATLTDPAKPLHVDVLGGLMWLHSTAHASSSLTYQGRIVDGDSYNASDNSFSFVLGPALRYRLVPRVELVLNTLVNVGLNGNYNSFDDRLFSNVLVGVHYNFGE